MMMPSTIAFAFILLVRGLAEATDGPSSFPSATSSVAPSPIPSPSPSLSPSTYPSVAPSPVPSLRPSVAPSSSSAPTTIPSPAPSATPSSYPSVGPSRQPSSLPSVVPSAIPSATPSSTPSAAPTAYSVGFDPIGQSGKFRVSTRLANVTVALDSLYELDADGNQLGTSGKAKHSLQTFASQAFDFDEEVIGPYDGQSGPNAAMLPFHSPIHDVGTIEVKTFIYKESGSVTTDGSEAETWNVTTGDFKWNIILSNWNWCGDAGFPCKKGQTSQVGDKIDVTIEMKGAEAAKEATSDGKHKRKYDIGGGIQVFLSEKLKCDGEWKQMEAGFPAYSVRGSKELWTFRFPKFSDECVYDPLLNTGAVIEQEAEDAASGKPSSAPSDAHASDTMPPTSESQMPSLSPLDFSQSSNAPSPSLLTDSPLPSNAPSPLVDSPQPSNAPSLLAGPQPSNAPSMFDPDDSEDFSGESSSGQSLAFPAILCLALVGQLAAF